MRFFWYFGNIHYLCSRKSGKIMAIRWKYNHFFLLIGVCLFAVSVSAQDRPKPTSEPDLQTRHETFFDPDALKQEAEKYRFQIEWRVEADYQQTQHRTRNTTYENLYLHGTRVGVTADFMLPYRFSIQTGVLYTFTYGTATQKWGPMSWQDYSAPDPVTMQAHSGNIRHRLYEHQLTIPVKMYYNVHLWRQMNLFFYTGPQMNIGLVLQDNMRADISDATRQWLDALGQPNESYDRFADKELHRVGVQWTLGGGLEWDRYRLQAGYDFGLNNAVRHKRISNQHMWEWGWNIGFCIRIN